MTEFDDLKNAKFYPPFATFQLTANRQFARHGKLPILSGQLDRNIVNQEIERAWNLYPYAEDELFYYYN